MRLVILLSIAVLASSATLNDADLCTKSQTFRCQSLAVAETCGAVDHCMETTWKNKNMAKDESTVCIFCQAVISDAQRMLAADKSENEVVAFLSSASDLLPDVAKGSQIKKTLERKSLQNILNSEIEPQVVCNLLDICRGLPDEEGIHRDESSLQDTPEQPREADDPTEPASCSDCTKFFTSLKNFISGATPAFLSDILLDAVCPHTGSYKKLCEEMTKSYLQSILNITAGYLNPIKACQSIRMCQKLQIKNDEEASEVDPSSMKWHEVASFLTEVVVHWQPMDTTDGLQQPNSCADCKNFFTSLKNILKDETPAFVTDIIVDQVCSRLGRYRTRCEKSVRDYLPSALQFAVYFLDPTKVCQLATMCKKSSSQFELNSISWTKLIIPSATNNGPKTCEACRTGVQFVQTFLKSETVKQSIEVLIGNLVCVRLGPFRATCKKLVKTELTLVFNLLARIMDPSKVCRMLRLCQKSDVILDEVSLPVLEESEPLGSVECMMCETVISIIRTAIDNNKTEEEILRAMHDLCTRLPSGRAVAVCNRFVNNYGTKVIDAIRNQLEPHDICVKFGFCTTLHVDRSNPTSDVDSNPCIICKSVVQYLEAYVEDSDTVAMIQTQLKKILCHSLPPPVEEKMCLPFVDKYIPWLLYELSVYSPPKFFCTKIRICTA